ncbi:hypothetical protein Q765_09875 [Flavobacterium rivuli WB 3.3-2 = DSM 21788]|uniref:Lipoprotein n=1 Tax=Flavobacterium rivuli WB 3.3-2 = DSM 21788 TaxID=1121895 RepID=A0A0A2M2N4_9FLAO|nr:hypothetical protein [Flavobacterium rivuli]KGO86529.1 hypothetical protein Q765_09875 [Flavobacterium rivuli WB 3.3-2 = DSM 21788]
MNNLKFLIIISFITFCSCNIIKEPDSASLQPNKQLEQLLRFFVEKNPCEKCYYELYINKEFPEKFILTIYTGKFSLTQDENIHYNQLALEKLTVSGKEFKVFSGAEHYFNNKKIHDERKKFIIDTFPNNNYIRPVTWTAIDSAGTITITSYTGTYPFSLCLLNMLYQTKTLCT